MRSIAERVLGMLPAGVQYADVRVVRRRHEGLHVENDAVGQILLAESTGVGLRVLLDGQWSFAATARLDPDGLERLVRNALAQARAAAGAGPAVRLAPAKVVREVYATPLARDPFMVPIDTKIAVLLAAAAAMRRAGGQKLRTAEASMDFFRDEKVFANSEGSLIEQTLTESGAGLLATAVAGADMQRRSYPQSVPRAIRGQRGDFATRGYEHVERMRLVEEAPRVAEEAVALLTAAACPSKTTTLIVGGTQMALLVHETAGHPAELDRVLGSEASLSGGSYMNPGQRGVLRFGSDLVNITADATLPGGLGSFAYDDEGVPAQRTPIVAEGVFVGYLTSRESAGALDLAATGAARADGWQRVPLVRMTNVSLEPSDERGLSLDEMIAATDDGILVDMNKSLSIDDQRLSFRFGCEIGWEIKRGRLGRMLKSCTYSGITPRFWAGCDAIGNRASFRLYGIPSCNKGEPLQVAHIGHGTVPARFRDVAVGVA
jgi:TldD protein